MFSFRSRKYSCDGDTGNVTSYVEGLLSDTERRRLQTHASKCLRCTREIAAYRDVRDAVRALPVRVPPADLNTRLKVLASREIVRRRSRETFADLLDTWFEQLRLIVHNLMRPFAVPTAGGIVSAIVMFGVLAPVLAVPTVSVSANSEDVRTGLYTAPSVIWVQSVAPFNTDERDIAVELTVDGDGRMVDYLIAEASNTANSAADRRKIEYQLLFTKLSPATSFGSPTKGRVNIVFRSSRIDVRG